MIETLVLIVVGTAAVCVIILFAATVRVALARTLREDRKKIAALADSARLDRNLPLHVNLKLQEISAIAKGDEFIPEIPPEVPQPFPPQPFPQSAWNPPRGEKKQ